MKRLLFILLLFTVTACTAKEQMGIISPHDVCIQEIKIKRLGNDFFSVLNNDTIKYITIDKSFNAVRSYKDPFNKRSYYIFSNSKGASISVPKQFGIYKDGATFRKFPNSKTDKFGEYYCLSKTKYSNKMDGAICVKKYKNGEFIHAYFAYHDKVELGWHNIVITYLEPLPINFRFESFKKGDELNKKFVKEFKNRALNSFKILPKD